MTARSSRPTASPAKEKNRKGKGGPRPPRPSAGQASGPASPLWRRALQIVLALGVLGLALLVGFHRPVLTWMADRLVERDALQKADAIVVLAGERGERVAHGVALFRKGWAPLLVMSGGPSEANVPLARLMRDQAVQLGVPASAILLEDTSDDTGENARDSLRLARERGFKSIILVTSPYHSRRAAALFRSVYGPAGIAVISAPVENAWFSPHEWWKRKKDCKIILLEYAKETWYGLFRLSRA